MRTHADGKNPSKKMTTLFEINGSEVPEQHGIFEFVPQQILSKVQWKTAALGKPTGERSTHEVLWDHKWKEPVTYSPDILKEFTL